MAKAPNRYAELAPTRPADDLERELQERWREERLFEQTLQAHAGAKNFVFFDGPPTANGKPGIHHVFSRTLKDLFCRHRAMKGFHVARKAGWDTHGLPVEIEVEKQLGLSGKQEIEAFGVVEFNRRCRESVWTYKDDWEKLSERIGYWLDYDNAYVTYTSAYIESVWWSLATLYGKGLLVRGHKILPYCPRCGTALSSHEVAQGYEDVEDPSVYVALDIVAQGGDRTSAPNGHGTSDVGNGEGDARTAPISDVRSPMSAVRILVWTTTPWTLVSNVALAVHPDLEYVEVKRRNKNEPSLILAGGRLTGVFGADWDKRWEVLRHLRGSELLGWRYRRPFDWLPYPEGKEHETIVAGDFVSADDGSGVVHMAPAFGADDYAAGQKYNLAFLQPVNSRGEFPSDLPVVGGMFVKKADELLIEELKKLGVLWKAQKITHSYPHCWRCHTPLLYYARGSWFVKTTAYKEEMIARNERVDWHPPETGSRRFGAWLEDNVDWAISRDRYWGTPLPLWVCDADENHVEAIGSFADLATRTGAALPKDFDPHKPFVDEYRWPCKAPGCQGVMKRVPEVIDTWFDSGAMSFAQWHYPFENRELLQGQYPADFICEGVDQTRGWFYSLLAIASGLGDALPNNSIAQGASASRPDTAPYRHVLVNDVLQDDQGLKMSKHKGNVVDPWRVMKEYGADAARLFLVATADVSIPRKFDERALREQAVRFFIQLKNVYTGVFAQYANFGWSPSELDPPPEQRSLLDRWMLSRLTAIESEVDDFLERYDATSAARAIMTFVDDEVANWYARRTKDRLYDVDGADNRAAFATLYEVLVVTCRLLAPIAPFLPDWLHRELTGGESVHLAPFARTNPFPRDPALESAMEAVRELAKLGRAAREDAKIKVRQPLLRAVCVAPGADQKLLRELVPILAAELNVKSVEFAATGDALVTLKAKANHRSLGKRFGKNTPLAAAAIEAFTSAELVAFEAGEPLAITLEGEPHMLTPDDVKVLKSASGDLRVQEAAGFVAAIDPTVTDELRLEGLAREIVSRVQRMRKEASLAVSDRIRLSVAGGSDVQAAVSTHGAWIANEVLATDLLHEPGIFRDSLAEQVVDLDGVEARIALTRTE
ncbi:MAG TPA: isoleucine--tRNA ligase [Gemmatimonadaceae bacterium]|nr:isoleucine--tRNA ligase [Gemmatimonadaceae bacterium]